MNLYTNYKNTDDNLDVVLNEMTSNMNGFDSITLVKPSQISQLSALSSSTIAKKPEFQKPSVFTTELSGMAIKKPVIVAPISSTTKDLSAASHTFQRPTSIGVISKPKIDVAKYGCPEHSTYSSAKNGCVCNSGYMVNATLDGCVPVGSNCPDNSTYDSQNDTCVCKDGYVADSTGRNCVPDTSGSGNGGSGNGGSGSYDSGCPENSSYNSSDGRCHCNEGYQPNNDGTSCVKYSGEYTDDKNVEKQQETTTDKTKTSTKDDNRYYYMAGGIILAGILVYLIVKTNKKK